MTVFRVVFGFAALVCAALAAVFAVLAIGLRTEW